MTATKLQMRSPDTISGNIDWVAERFPHCITESVDDDGRRVHKIDFDLLRQELASELVDGPLERYHLNWPGKREAMLAANAPIAKTLRPRRDQSVDFDTTQNLFITGDNLEALKLLQETYLGKVKLIYIDPPYNTGNDFIYDDDFAEEAWQYFSRSTQRDEEGNRLVANAETNGRFHSDWLSMLYARLRVARSLLRDDGFIVVSIDDAEMHSARHLLDEIFGSSNAMAVLVWDKNRKNDARFFSVGHEYMLVYAKNKQHLLDTGVKLREPKPGFDEAVQLFERLKQQHGNDWDAIQSDWREYHRAIPDSDERKPLGRYSKIGPRGPYRDDGDISWPGGNGPKYDVIHPATGKPCKQPRGGWVYPTIERFDEAVAEGRVVFGDDETTLPRQARYLFDSAGQVMRSVFYSYAQTATVEFAELMGDRVFDNPKNWRDLKRIIAYLTDPEDIILDFFAGSASTAHAVMEMNAADSGQRRWILVQVDEPVHPDSVAAQQGYRTIDEIARDRIRKAADSISERDSESTGDLGFRTLQVATSNLKDVYYSPGETSQAMLGALADHVKPDRTREDLLFQVLLDCGVDLSSPIQREVIDSHEVFIVNEGDLIACFDPSIPESLIQTIAGRRPQQVVLRDHCYHTDDIKLDFERVFKQLSPQTQLRSL